MLFNRIWLRNFSLNFVTTRKWSVSQFDPLITTYLSNARVESFLDDKVIFLVNCYFIWGILCSFIDFLMWKHEFILFISTISTKLWHSPVLKRLITFWLPILNSIVRFQCPVPNPFFCVRGWFSDCIFTIYFLKMQDC